MVRLLALEGGGGVVDREYFQYKGADIVSHILPRKFAYWVGLRVADSMYRRDVRGRRAVISNLRHILEFQGVSPSRETLRRLSRKTFQYFGKYLVDFFRFKQMPIQRVEKFVSIEKGESMKKAERTGKGVLAVGAHLGSWEIGGAVLAALGHPASVVVLPESNRRIDRLFQKRRKNRGMRLLPVGRAAMGIVRALEKREWAAVLADRDYSGRNDPIDFFGKPARLPRGPALISARTGAPLLPVFLLREPDDTFLLRFHEPINASGEGAYEEIRLRLCRVLEAEIAARPEQWFMFEDFWGWDLRRGEQNS
ncbi:MAG: lysophospholipid acyltransferase family protein [Kiritimatiellia bacterium]